MNHLTRQLLCLTALVNAVAHLLDAANDRDRILFPVHKVLTRLVKWSAGTIMIGVSIVNLRMIVII